jgi:HK97 family phage major capsid protein
VKHIFLACIMFDAMADTKGGGFDAITKSIGELGEAHKKQIGEVKESLQNTINDKIKEVKDDFETRATEAKSLAQQTAEQLKAFEQKAATNGFGGNGRGKSIGDTVHENLIKNKSNLPLSVKGKFEFELDVKAVGNMGSSANLTGSYFVAPTVVPGIVTSPYNETHLRNLLPTGTTDSNVVRHIRDLGGEGGPAMVAEAGSKPQMDRDFSIIDAGVRKLATHLRVPEEMIEDIPWLTSFITEIGVQEVLAVEDTQILYGDGTGQNLSGIALSGNFTAFAAGTSVVGNGTTVLPNEFDVLRAAQKQMRTLKRTPSFALVSPTNYFDMISRRDTTGNYILSGGGNGLVPTLDGVPIIQLNQITAGDFIVMDRRAAQIFFRSNVSVRFYDQDQDNAIKNMVTIVIEERLTLCIYYVTGIIKGTFAAGITDLTS